MKPEIYCPEDCNGSVTTEWADETFLVGDKELTIHIPEHTCQSCGLRFLDHVAEDIREKAVKEFLSKLAKDEEDAGGLIARSKQINCPDK